MTNEPKKCEHGVPMVYVRKMWSSWWEPAESCEPCMEAAREAERQSDEELERIYESARRRRLEREQES